MIAVVFIIAMIVAGVAVFFFRHARLARTGKEEYILSVSRALGITEASARQMVTEAMSSTPSQIIPRLYLGNSSAASNANFVRNAGVTHVLNATSTLPNHFEGKLRCKLQRSGLPL